MTEETTSSAKRSIEMEIEVAGTPEQVWEAIATGPGISSWYVPHTVEAAEGGAMTASFGDSPEMQVNGRVGVWDPPRRVMFDGGDPEEGLAFEWLVEARDGGSCVVRLVNSGFGAGGEWDDQYDAMRKGWEIFLANLRLHLEHFPGQAATAKLPMAYVEIPAADAWGTLTARLGISSSLQAGDRLEVTGDGLPKLAGTVAEVVNEHHVLVVADEPAPGTAFIATEQQGPMTGASIWLYLYGDDGAAAAERDAPAWQEVLNDLTP